MEELKNKEISHGRRKIKWSKIRRFVMLGIFLLFLLQFLRVKILVGGLTGSLVLWFINLVDVYAYLEILVSSKVFEITVLLTVLPVIAIYFIFGRAFCGWVCPMDFLFEMIYKMRLKGQRSALEGSEAMEQGSGVLSLKTGDGILPESGYVVAALFLGISALTGIPFFSNYISHLTNLFRLLTGGIFISLGLPFESIVVVYSVSLILVLLVLEYLFPRLWCRVLCPVGKTYGLFNKMSLLRLEFVKGECGECNLCEHMCYMKVKITPHIDRPTLRDTDCIYCGRCVDGCNLKGKIIKMKIGGLR